MATDACFTLLYLDKIISSEFIYLNRTLKRKDMTASFALLFSTRMNS